ncbi:glycosyltransferase [Butyrivibrio fibrisolvens]|uniref:glycosyltransferase n=1 Tax=Butyrivibrio fibrisolvens TaxID=831 RepID=UPI0004229729|nr:glycosyltransferase [Butyrivibrio fibrisolvens]
MNIMFEIFSFNVGGIEKLIIDMSNSLIQKGHKVWLCVINDDQTKSMIDSLNPGVTILELKRPIGNKNDFKYMRKLAKYVRKNHIDVIHCHGINCVIFSGLCKIGLHKPVIINTVHDSGNYPKYSNFKVQLANLFLDKTIAISDSVKAEILARNVPKDKVITIHNAIDTRRFNHIDRHTSYNIEIKSCPIISSKIEIINVARFYPDKKGQDLLIYAIEKLVPKIPTIHVTFAGDIFKGQQENYDKLQKYIKNRDLTKYFTFLGNVNDVPALLADGDIFVLPSRYEGFGISLIEALATGMPSIAANLEGPAEIMNATDKGNLSLGLLFTPGDADDLANKIEQLIDNYLCYDQKSISEYIVNKYDMNTMISKHLSVYSELL